MKITSLCSITSDWKTFCSTGENPDHLVTTKENLNEELLQNSEKRDDLEMKVVQIVIYNHKKNQMDLKQEVAKDRQQNPNF